MSTTRYQEGSIEQVTRAKGPDVWVYRWRELQVDGTRVQRKKTIGDLKRFPRQSDVKREVENLRAAINAASDRIGKITIQELWGHFQKEELYRLRDGEPEGGETHRSPTTIDCYLDNFRLHIIPKWGDTYVNELKTVAVEKWLGGLKFLHHQRGEVPMAPGTKAKLRNQLSCLYSHAIRHELANTDPIKGLVKGSGVRQSSKRVSVPDILTLSEMQAILAGLFDPMHRIAILIAAVTGLRRSEIRGLKWSDFDFENLWLKLKRGVVRKDQTRLRPRAAVRVFL